MKTAKKKREKERTDVTWGKSDKGTKHSLRVELTGTFLLGVPGARC